ncbi:M24 family metallopeptidase [Glaciecola petra]|uniref:M24 family metallopeptidase n=1 Tax=Glaciecola petra TaxID=3075602 RepID=A0ABU2ZUE3_9ALTE|nr:M24 family metallopeptidase [Aestuariibacter sp. P117]MDT0596263.1 M24 family metallopeptidase [Aestuariibacter sp. P117]
MLRFLLTLLLISQTALANSTNDNPWFEIRKQRISQLLPLAMQKAQIDAWLILCRENNNDPLAIHIGCENAGKTAVFAFYFDNNKFESLAFSPIGEATALAEANIVNKVIPVPRTDSAIDLAAAMVKQQNFESIAVNISENNAQADGLSYMQHKKLSQALGPKLAKRLVYSDELVYQWLAIKLPQEVEIMRQAAELTARWQLEAYANVIVGETTDADVAAFLKQKMAEAGVTDAWASDQNPNVNSGTDRGHSHATNRIIQAGDVIQTDFGIRVHDTWVTDIQRFAYVLKSGETKPPSDILRYWEGAKNGREAAFKAMKPGVKGIEVDAAQRAIMASNGSLPVMWSTGHPVGYVAHDTGPNLGGSKSPSLRPAAQRVLQEGMTFAFDGFYSWLLSDGSPKTISVEEMVVITQNGAEYLIPPQQDLVLIPSGDKK